jgi:hypothetical protein
MILLSDRGGGNLDGELSQSFVNWPFMGRKVESPTEENRAMEIEMLEGRLLMTHAAHVAHLAHEADLAHLARVAHTAHFVHHTAAVAHLATVAREAHTAQDVAHLKHEAHVAHFLRTTVPEPIILTAMERTNWPKIRDEFLANLKRIPK